MKRFTGLSGVDLRLHILLVLLSCGTHKVSSCHIYLLGGFKFANLVRGQGAGQRKSGVVQSQSFHYLLRTDANRTPAPIRKEPETQLTSRVYLGFLINPRALAAAKL